VLSVIGFLFGLVYITEGGFNWLGTIDGFVNGTWGIAFMGLLECIVLGWLWRIDILRRHANSRSDWKLGKWWDYLIRMVIPVVLGSLFFWQLFDDNPLTREFWKTADDKWILTNCIGMAVLIFVPILAVIFSVIKGRSDIKESERPEQKLFVGGKREGAIALIVALVIAVLLVLRLTVLMPQTVKGVILWLSLIGGVISMLVSNYVLDKHHTSTSKASWLARWAGIMATMDVSASIAIILMGLAKTKEVEETTAPIRDTLHGISYIILAVVFLIIIGGLGWCFYRALTAAGKDTGIQRPDEVGDEQQQEQDENWDV
jgi:NSS family neurotransmitter:Na+ symporter